MILSSNFQKITSSKALPFSFVKIEYNALFIGIFIKSEQINDDILSSSE